MDSTFQIKKVGTKAPIAGRNGESISKLTIVITSKECRMGDNGPFIIDQDYVVDLLGERADNFTLAEGSWIVGSLSFTAREYNGSFFQDIRLNRYCKLG